MIKHAIDHVRSDSYFEAILGVVQRLLSEKSEAAVELGDQGLCDQLDNILGQKIASQSICGLCLLIILALLKNNSTLSRSLPRSALLTAVVGLVTNVDEYGNKKRLTSSSTIFRIVKACHTHNTDPSVLQTGLEIISMMLTESGRSLYDTPLCMSHNDSVCR